jgi:hypothetical protein
MEKIVDFWDDITTLLDCKRAGLHVSKRIKDVVLVDKSRFAYLLQLMQRLKDGRETWLGMVVIIVPVMMMMDWNRN